MAEVFEVRGIDEVIANLKGAILELRKKAARQLYQIAKEILTEAKRRTPVRSGQLRDSGQVSEPEITEDEISVVISFGNETVKWAIPVHERTYVKHLSGQSKFLSTVVEEYAGRLAQELSSGVSF